MSHQSRSCVRRHIMAAVVVTATIAAPASAQSAPDCAARDCASSNQIWVPAAQLHELKNQFVATVRQFTEAIAGSYGDEGARIPSSIDAMERARVQWDDGIRFYEGILARFADTAEVHVGLGTVYLDRHRIDDALRELAQAARLEPRRADVHSLSALAYGLGNRSEDAVRSLTNASTLDGGNPITLYGLAQSLIKSGRHDQARDVLRTFQQARHKQSSDQAETKGPAAPFERVSLFRQVAGVAPIFPLRIYRPGFTLLLDGNYEEAVAEFRRAAAADPMTVATTSPIDAVAQAGAALRRGQLAAAVSGLEAAVDATPNRSEAHRILGIAYWADEQYDKGVSQLSAAIRLAPRDERSRLGLADVLVDAGRASEAERVLNDALKDMPDSGQAHYRLGQLYQTLSLLPQTIHEFETAATLTPLVGLDRLYDTIGGLYVSQANFDGAVDAYAKRVDVNPNNTDAHRKLGEIYFLQGRDDEALAEFVAALLVDSRSSDALAAACQVYSRMGRYAEAIDSARQALALDARHTEAQYALATSLMRLGRAEEGKRELEVFQRLKADAMANTQRQSELKVILRNAALSLDKGEYVAAAGLLRQAVTVDPKAADVQRDLGIALMKAGQFEAAIQPLGNALRLEDRAETHQLLADTYKAIGRLEDSQAQAVLSARAVERRKEERLRKIGGSR